jgi:hypothetical protein
MEIVISSTHYISKAMLCQTNNNAMSVKKSDKQVTTYQSVHSVHYEEEERHFPVEPEVTYNYLFHRWLMAFALHIHPHW